MINLIIILCTIISILALILAIASTVDANLYCKSSYPYRLKYGTGFGSGFMAYFSKQEKERRRLALINDRNTK